MGNRGRLFLAVGLLLVVAAGLMIGAMRQESATVDETVFLSAGWSYWQGYRYRLNPEHPPLLQLIAAAPLTMLGVKLTPYGEGLLTGHVMADTAGRWNQQDNGEPARAAELFPRGPNFYHYPEDEEFVFGGILIYGGQNDAERLMFWGRIPEVLLTLVTALLVLLWARRLQGDAAGLLAAAMFLLNPVMLAYGHIVQSDIGMALAFPLSCWMFARLLEAPSVRRAVWAGLALGLALAIKYTAVILGPTFAVLWLVDRWRHRGAQPTALKHVLIVAACAWGMILALYIPHWSPAPPIDSAMAAKLGVPHWFIALRPILIPAEYFKGAAITLLHASGGNEAYLNGRWSHSGWWYYFPLAFAMKTPVPFLIFVGAGIALATRSRGELRLAELAAWVGAFVYLLSAMCSKADIGVRHILPVYPLVSIGSACLLVRWAGQVRRARQRLAGWIVVALPVASLVCVALAYPGFICYMNRLAGGTGHGYEHLLDSNYDWGQDVIRLRRFLDEHGIGKIYLQYFGTQAAIEYYGIANDFVGSDAAKQIQEGYLVVSVEALMRPEWEWLRQSHQPVARVGYTLFVYHIGSS
jgi:4-amino-4-deoxy-L-arabinose transferase-like glycosyltransferase